MIMYRCDTCDEKDVGGLNFSTIGDLIFCKDCYRKIMLGNLIDEFRDIIFQRTEAESKERIYIEHDLLELSKRYTISRKEEVE